MDEGLGIRYLVAAGAGAGGFFVVGGAAVEGGATSSSGRLSATLRVRAFLINSGTSSSSNDRRIASSMGLCCGVLLNWLAQGATCFSSALSSFFFSKSSKFLGRDLAFCRISFMSMPAEDLAAGGGAFLLGSFPFLV